MINKLKVLVVGTGRCGTLYMAKLLTQMGVPCAHESLFNWEGMKRTACIITGELETTYSDVSKKWNHHIGAGQAVAESSYMAVPFLNHPICKNIPVIHLVRDPIKVINSFIHYVEYFSSNKPRNRYEKFIYQYLDPQEMKHLLPHERAAHFYIIWNKMIQKCICGNRRYLLCPIEYCDILKVAAFVGSNLTDVYVDTKTNSWQNYKSQTRKITWQDFQDSVVKDELIRLAEFYDYEVGYAAPN